MAIIGLIFVISGIYPKFTGIIHAYITYSFLSYCDVIDGGDHLASNLTLLLIPITLLDNSKNHWLKNGLLYRKNYYLKLIQKTFYTLIHIQVCSVYLHAFVGKLFIDEWLNGTAAYYWLTNKYFGVHVMFTDLTVKILSNEFVTTFVTWGTLLLEFALASFIFVSRKSLKRRFLLFIIAILFHFCIFIFHGLASFFMVMFAAATIYLIPKNINYQVNFKS
ncbi:hypothetical protein [Chryseobacterium sp. MFBS3-17]|uniref:hypothetical protein n=1 Tax=Chryseobacterium sp. MFBS3-17 TaxID=2886689 RepID=UPI001D0E8A4E|nr:hypothetical protein [Chryseobacterium sp. MFBS3-17]MCC2590089.1 hypothetical protein [Chryseobacterium sp. MFBS3-17]